MATATSSFDDRVLALASINPPWPADYIEGKYVADDQEIRQQLARGDLGKLPAALYGPVLTSMRVARQAIYDSADLATATTALSRACYANYLSGWSEYATIPEPAALRGRLDVVSDFAALSIWLGFRPGIELGCLRAERLVAAQGKRPISLDVSHLNFCLALCNAQGVVAPLPRLDDPEPLEDDIYATLPFPAPGSSDAIPLSVLQAVLEERIERAHRSNTRKRDAGGHFYGGIQACVMPNEIMAYYRWFKNLGKIEFDVALDPWIDYLEQIHYDASVEQEPVFLETKAFVESCRLR